MSSNILNIHPVTPQEAKIALAAETLRSGGVLLYPTDTGFALGCDLANKSAIARVREIRRLAENKPMTFLCDSLTNIAEYAKVTNAAYKTIKRLIPGPYTFILPATKAVPKFAQDPKRSTIGIRVPNYAIASSLLKEMGSPIISITAKAGDHPDLTDIDDIMDILIPMVDLTIIPDSAEFAGESTVIDMTTDDFAILREGAGMELASQYIETAVL